MSVQFISTMPGASADYLRYIFEQKIRKTDRYMDSTLLDFALVPVDGAFKLSRGAYVKIITGKYGVWYTGYVTNDPELTYLGKDPVTKRPVWGYRYQATSDEYILSLKPLGIMPTFFNATRGQILKALVERLTPGMFDVSGIQDGPLVAQYVVDPDKKFIDVVREFCEEAAFVFYGKDHKLYFEPQDTVTGGLVLDGNDPHFTPSRLSIKPASTPVINDVLVLGGVEPQTHMTEYFVGTGLDASFPLVGSVFGADTSVLLDETFSGSQINASNWRVKDTPSRFLQVESGYLNCLGGSGNNTYDVALVSVNPIPLEGRLRLTHGEWDFLPSGGEGYIGACWTDEPNAARSGLLYGLYVNNLIIKPVLNGVVDSTQSVTLDPNYRYVIRTIVEFSKDNRVQQSYSYIDQDGSRQTVGGAKDSGTATWQTLITQVNPADGTIVNQWTFKNTGPLSASAAFAYYAPLASNTLHASVTGITVSVPINATLETATIVPFKNLSFDEWSSLTEPTGWTEAYQVFEETDYVYFRKSAKLDPAGGVAKLAQPAVDLIEPRKVYNLSCRLMRNPALTQGTFRIYLKGTGVDSGGLTLNVNSIPYDWKTFTARLTAPMDSIPEDLTLQVELQGANGPMWVDSILIVSDFQQELIGPNEIDAMDGLAPIATIVQSNTGAETRNSLSGAPQYNPGQAQLVFFKDSVTRTSNIPPQNQLVRLSYRTAGGALGRAINRESINTEATKWGDEGTRSLVRSDLSPRPRTSLECEMAAAAIVGENSFTHYEGTYMQWSDYFEEEPRSGGIVKFLNLPEFAGAVAEEINEVVTTLEADKPVERYLHQISFGKPDVLRRLLSKFAEPKGAFQRNADATGPVAIDITSVGLAYAPDVTQPRLLGWDEKFIYVDAGQDLPPGAVFEVRYTDTGWGVDDGKNLITRSTSRVFAVPRTLRGRVFFIKQANSGNLLAWSEDQTKPSYSGASVTKKLDRNPDGELSDICTVAFAAGGALSTTASQSGGSFSFSVKGAPGTVITARIGSTTKEFTLSGAWQRFTVTGSGSQVSISSDRAGAVQTTRWSVEAGQKETMYVKTGATPYGPVSRYAAGVHVGFPPVESTLSLDDPGDAPQVLDTSTADVWYREIENKGWYFGFQGTVNPPADNENFGGCVIYIRWEGEEHYVRICETSKEGGAWVAEPGYPLTYGFSKDVDVVFVPKNKHGIENTDKASAFKKTLTVTSQDKVTTPPTVVSVTVEEKPNSRRLVRREDGVYVTWYALRVTVQLTGTPGPNEWVSIWVSENNQDWAGAWDFPITSQTQSFDIDGFVVPAYGGSYWAKALTHSPDRPGSPAQAVACTEPAQIAGLGDPAANAVQYAEVSYKESTTSEGVRVWGPVLRWLNPSEGAEPNFWTTMVRISWVDANGNPNPEYGEAEYEYSAEFTNNDRPGELVIHDNGQNWLFPAADATYKKPRFTLWVKNRAEKAIKQHCWADGADHFDLDLTLPPPSLRLDRADPNTLRGLEVVNGKLQPKIGPGLTIAPEG